MNCCTECFSDPQIQTMISKDGRRGTCDFCKKENVFICKVDEASDVSDLISEVLNVYEEDENGEFLFSAIVNNWNIFRKDILSSYDLIASFCSTIYGDDGKLYNRKVRIPKSYTDEFGIFSGHTWREFSDVIKTKNRFLMNISKRIDLLLLLDIQLQNIRKGQSCFVLAYAKMLLDIARKIWDSLPAERENPVA